MSLVLGTDSPGLCPVARNFHNEYLAFQKSMNGALFMERKQFISSNHYKIFCIAEHLITKRRLFLEFYPLLPPRTLFAP